MMKAVSAAGMIGVLTAVAMVQGKAPQPNQVAPLMKAKLEHAQRVLEGITLGDTELVAKHSQALSLIAQEASWRVLQTPDYLRHSADFRHAADAMTNAARQKNLDAAALGYLQLTMTCVNCHKHVRDAKDQ